MEFRDRIQELRRVRASELKHHPHNWRRHPTFQGEALKGILTEVGFADALLAREQDDGELELIDGHLRAEITGDQIVPVLILDVDEAESAKLLATLDPLASLAEPDAAELDRLLTQLHITSQPLLEMLSQLAPTEQSIGDNETTDPAQQALRDSYHILVECDDEHQQAELLQRWQSEGLTCRALIA